MDTLDTYLCRQTSVYMYVSRQALVTLSGCLYQNMHESAYVYMYVCMYVCRLTCMNPCMFV